MNRPIQMSKMILKMMTTMTMMTTFLITILNQNILITRI